jgi:hypothetical protein
MLNRAGGQLIRSPTASFVRLAKHHACRRQIWQAQLRRQSVAAVQPSATESISHKRQNSLAGK